MTEIRVLGPGDLAVLDRVADDVFDGPVQRELAREFLEDPRHHLAVAIDEGVVVGMASAVHYVHPDKPAELWINEVGVAETHLRKGIASRLLGAIFQLGRKLGCATAWVLTDRDNKAAMRLYEAIGGGRDSDQVVMYSFRLEDYRR